MNVWVSFEAPVPASGFFPQTSAALPQAIFPRASRKPLADRQPRSGRANQRGPSESADHPPRESPAGNRPERAVFHWRTLWPLLRASYQEWGNDKCPRMGAALAYYAVFSIGPFLVVAITIAGLIFGSHAATQAIIGEIGN